MYIFPPLTFDFCFWDIEHSPVTSRLYILSRLSLSLKYFMAYKSLYSLKHLTILCNLWKCPRSCKISVYSHGIADKG